MGARRPRSPSRASDGCARPTRSRPGSLFAVSTPLALGYGLGTLVAQLFGDDVVGVGVAAAALLAAALAHVVAPGARQAPSVAWVIAVVVVGVVALGYAASGGSRGRGSCSSSSSPCRSCSPPSAGDPFTASDPMRHLAWLSLALAVAAVWAWLAGDGVDDVEAYTLPLAAALAATAGLITWRRAPAGSTAAGRTALFGAAAAVAVLPSVASSGDSELRTLVLCAAGAVVALASMFLPESARGVPDSTAGHRDRMDRADRRGRGARRCRRGRRRRRACCRSSSGRWSRLRRASSSRSRGLATTPARGGRRGAARGIRRPRCGADADRHRLRRCRAICVPPCSSRRSPRCTSPAAASTARPIAGPIFAWTTRGALVVGGAIALSNGNVDPFDIVTASVGVAFIGWGALSMRRSPELGSWPALGPGLAVLLVPPLIADFTDPELWRIVALGLVSAAAVLIGAMRRLQAPLLFGGAVLLVHAIAQLWPVIIWLYEAVWWWLWLGIAGVIFVVSRRRTSVSCASRAAPSARSRRCADRAARRASPARFGVLA